jgi:Acetyl-CoA carboxylase, carboxyltransferase component (subunits alpha and beta)
VTDQRYLRHRIPENRVRIYDVRALIQDLADQGTVLELRAAFAPAMITALVRIGGKPFGLMANNPAVLGGAINADAADKAARFMQLCGAFGIPIVSLCDTPGFMVGPEAEKEATVRHVSRLFVTAASLQVPVFTIVLRKGYGLGAQAMAGGNLHAPVFSAAWPTGEFGAMGLEGAVRLGYAEELAAIEDPAERQALFDQMVARAYEQGKALNTASYLEIDAVIDPADTRHWILQGLMSCGDSARTPSRPGFIDTW